MQSKHAWNIWSIHTSKKNLSCDRSDILAHDPRVFLLWAGLGISCSFWVISKVQWKHTGKACSNIFNKPMSVCHGVGQHILRSKITNAKWCKLVLGFVMNICKCPGIFAFGIIYSFELFLCQCLVGSLFEFYLVFFKFALILISAFLLQTNTKYHVWVSGSSVNTIKKTLCISNKPTWNCIEEQHVKVPFISNKQV